MDNTSFKNYYDDNGYVIAKSLIKKELIDKVLIDLEKCKLGSKRYFSQSTHTWVKFSDLTEEGFLTESIQTPTKQITTGPLRKSVENLIVSKSISEKLAILSGGFDKFVIWQNMLFDKSTGTVDHADTWYLDTMPKGLMVAAWVALEDIHEDAGRFFVIPKSNKLRLEQNSSENINDHYEYAKFIDNYVKTNIYSRRIHKDNMSDVNKNKLFNYIIQAHETETNIKTIIDLKHYLLNRKSKLVLYGYDSFLFDIHKDDRVQVFRELKQILERNGNLVKAKAGKNYGEMVNITEKI